MSDIAINAIRYYGLVNARRSDSPNPHNGEFVGKEDNGEADIGFDCSGFFCHVMVESGYSINYETTGGYSISKAFTTISKEEVLPGDMITFTKHMGIVIQYDQKSSLGKFIHMSGSDNKGVVKISYFVTDIRNYMSTLNVDKPLDPDHKAFQYGVLKPIISLRRVREDRYSYKVDLHVNASNPNPTLRPLGTSIYSNYILKIPKTKRILAKMNKNMTIPKKLQCKSEPRLDGYVGLISKLWGKLPDF